MLGLKLNHVSKKGPCSHLSSESDELCLYVLLRAIIEPYSCLVPVHSFQENYVKMVADLDHEELLA